MKKKMIVWLVIAALLAGGIYCISMEIRFSGSTIADSGRTPEEILKEMPEIEISFQDELLAQRVLNLPQVETLMDAENVSVDLATLPRDLLKDDMDVMELSVIRGQVNLALSPDETRSIRYVFVPGNEIAIQKVIGIYEERDGQPECTALYSNDGRNITKMVPKHLWFSWLTLK